MQALTCPQCGAPAQFPPGQPIVQCPYCHRQYAAPAPMMAPPPPQSQQQGPTFIIVHGPGGDDDDDFHHHHHHVPHVTAHAVASSMSWIIWVIAVTIIAGGGAAFAWFSKHSSIASSLVWDGKSPFQCGGTDEISVKGVEAQFTAGTAITVGGNCNFTCTDCTIKAPTVIEVGGNGQVTIVNGTVIGSEVLVDASGNAKVNIAGNVTSGGEVKKSSNAKVSAPKPNAPSAAAAASASLAAGGAATPAAAASAKAGTTAPKATANPAAKKK